jgi:hypothetical protein
VLGNKGGPSQDLRYWPRRGRNVIPPFVGFDDDVLDGGLIDNFPRWVNNDGTKLPYNKWLYKTDGWLGDLPFDSDFYSQQPYSHASKIPGFVEHILEGKQNLRSAIYRIHIIDGIVTLQLQQNINPGDIVDVLSGATYAGRQMYFEAYVKHGNVPRWWTLTQRLYVDPASGESMVKPHKETTFDSRGTRFFSYRDQYAEPETSTKYIKFPKYGVFT